MSNATSTVPVCSFSATFVYLHLPVDRWDSISSPGGSHVNHKDSIILQTWRWFIISIDICHILMTKCVGPCVNLCSPPGHRSDGETVIMALPDTWISSPSRRSATTVPRAWGARSTLWNWNLGESLIGLRQATEASCRGFKAAYSLGDRS